MAKIEEDVVMIRAQVERTLPDLTDYKVYRTELTFGGKLFVEVPVPASEVTQTKGEITLTLAGWKAFLRNYTKITTELSNEYLKLFQR